MVVYINGKEAGRYLMNSGTVNYNTFATTYTEGNPDHGTMNLSADLFKKGKNVIAVEIHNNSATSSDIYFDVALCASVTSTGDNILSEEEEFTLPSGSDFSLMACYEPLSEEELEVVRRNCKTLKEKALIELFFSTGCRVAEVANMKISDIDFREKTVRIFGKGVLAIKYELGLRTRRAYEAGDKETLRNLAKNEYVKVEKLIDVFARSFEKQWFKDNKPHGFDVQDHRLGALIRRTGACRRRILDYVNGKIDRIEELDEALLPYMEKGESFVLNGAIKSSTVNVPFFGAVL